MYRVMIIEDDPMVATINRQYVDTAPDFSVEVMFPSGVGALEYLKEHDVSLIILDYYTPMLNGMEFLDQLHGMGKAPQSSWSPPPVTRRPSGRCFCEAWWTIW